MTTVKVKAELFEFYLKSYRVDGHPSQLASRVDIDESEIESWRLIDSDISISNLRKIANVYKKHWGIFLLEKPPETFKLPKDYRARSSQTELGILSRLAFEEANRLIEIGYSHGLAQIDENVSGLVGSVKTPAVLSARVRTLLGLTLSKQSSWREDKDAWKYLTEKVEEMGFIVSLQDLEDGVDGFIVIKDEGVAIVINRNVKSVYRKTFTLLHELGHYFQGISAVCNTYELIHDEEAEAFADDFSSNVLVPQSQLALDEIIVDINLTKRDATEKDYEILAKKYCVSMSQIAVRFYKMKLISWDTLMSQLKKAEKIFVDSQKAALEKMKARKGFDPNGHERKAIARMSQPIVNSLLAEFHSGDITARDFASTVGVSINLVGRIESMLGNGRS